MKKWLELTLVIAVLSSCGGGKKAQEGINAILFDPNPAILGSGICSVNVQLVGDSDQDVTLLGAQITLTAQDDPSAQISYNDIDLESLFGRMFVKRLGFLEGELSIDGPARGMIGPFNAYFMVFGSGNNGYARNFLGYLECNE